MPAGIKAKSNPDSPGIQRLRVSGHARQLVSLEPRSFSPRGLPRNRVSRRQEACLVLPQSEVPTISDHQPRQDVLDELEFEPKIGTAHMGVASKDGGVTGIWPIDAVLEYRTIPVSSYLRSPARSLREVCHEIGRDAGGRRCLDCLVADLCGKEALRMAERHRAMATRPAPSSKAARTAKPPAFSGR